MNIEVTARGTVAESTKRRAREELARLESYVRGPLIGARVVLIQEQNPRIANSARAEGEVTLGGRAVRSRVAARSMDAAVDELAEHLRRELTGYVDRLVTRRRQAD